MKKRSIGNISKLREGKYRLRLSAGFDDFGRRSQPSKVVSCNNDREAEKLLIEFYNQVQRGQISHKSTPQTLKQLYDEWMGNHVNRNLSERTAQYYRELWNLHLSNKGKAKLKSLKPKNVYEIIDDVKGDRTKNAVFKMLKAILNKGITWEYIVDNPCNRVETPKYRSAEKKTLTTDDITKIVSILSTKELKYQAMFYFAAMCGMRRGEIIGLNWSDIDFKDNVINISRAAVEIHGKGTVTKETKTERSVRKLHLPDTLRIILLQMQNEQNKQIKKLGDIWSDEEWVFTQWDGKIMCINTPTNWWHDFARDNNIGKVTFHDLRHTAATFMIKNNVPLPTISRLMGHANNTTTLNIYAHVVEDTKKDAITMMEGLFATDSTEKNKACDI